MKLSLQRTSITLVLASLMASSIAGKAFPQRPSTQAPLPPNTNTTYIDAQGTAHITRVVPVPKTLSPEAQRYLASLKTSAAPASAPVEDSDATGGWGKLFPNQKIANGQIAGVPVNIVTPADIPQANRDKVLINLHAGGFRTDSGPSSIVEAMPIAGLTRMRVIGVLYRGVPKNAFPAAVDDVVAVYRELLKTYAPGHVVIYGSSAGAILTGEVAVRLKQLGLPLPAALGIFSGHGDFARTGDSRALYELGGFALPVPLPADQKFDAAYVASTDTRDPVLSPIYSDLHGLPPTLFVTSGRDFLLSGTSNLHRAFLTAGVDARLVVFDGLPHVFFLDPSLPESLEANHIMADFFLKELTK